MSRPGRVPLLRLEVTGDSMSPTLEPGDRVLIVRGLPVRAGALVAVPDPRWPGRLLVKRVAAVHGPAAVLVGDAPHASTDSRHFGPVRRSTLLGRAAYRYWPADRAGWLLRS